MLAEKACLLLALKPALGRTVLVAGGSECIPGSTLGQFVGEQIYKDRIFDRFCSLFPTGRLQGSQLVSWGAAAFVSTCSRTRQPWRDVGVAKGGLTKHKTPRETPLSVWANWCRSAPVCIGCQPAGENSIRLASGCEESRKCISLCGWLTCTGLPGAVSCLWCVCIAGGDAERLWKWAFFAPLLLGLTPGVVWASHLLEGSGQNWPKGLFSPSVWHRNGFQLEKHPCWSVLWRTISHGHPSCAVLLLTGVFSCLQQPGHLVLQGEIALIGAKISALRKTSEHVSVWAFCLLL